MIPLARFQMPKIEGRFGAIRKYDIHTGIDLYCNPKSHVYAIEEGIVVDRGNFTGPAASSPWWHDTQYVVLESKSGFVLYGEIATDLQVNCLIKEGEPVGTVQTVLRTKKDKPMTMLHLELYSNYAGPAIWNLDQPQPAGLLDPTFLLTQELYKYYDKNHKTQATVEIPEGEWFNISGRGKVMTVNLLNLDPAIRISVGDSVEIKEKTYLVKGIEYMSGFPKKSAGLLLTEIIDE